MTKVIGTSVGAILVFALTFLGLFYMNRSVFAQILAKSSGNSIVNAATEEHRQYVYWSFRTNEISKMIRDLAAERENLKQREDYISAEEARITSERKENDRLRQEITNARKELSDYLIEIQAGETARIKQEVSILNNMNPSNVVAVLNEKSDKETVKILSMMKPDMVAQILETMMAQPAEANSPTPEKHAAELLELLKKTTEKK